MMIEYIRLRRLGVRRAWELSGVGALMLRLTVCACAAAAVLVVLLGIAGKAQAIEDGAIARQADYVRQLEAALGRCLGEREGALVIGDRVYLCHAVDIGPL